jgi:hypothetical protein
LRLGLQITKFEIGTSAPTTPDRSDKASSEITSRFNVSFLLPSVSAVEIAFIFRIDFTFQLYNKTVRYGH